MRDRKLSSETETVGQRFLIMTRTTCLTFQLDASSLNEALQNCHEKMNATQVFRAPFSLVWPVTPSAEPIKLRLPLLI